MQGKCLSIDRNNITGFLESFDTVLCDCDGVIWNQANPIENSVETLNKLQELGKKVILVTNNSTRTRRRFYEKCQTLKLNVKEENIYCPSYVCVSQLKQLGFKKDVYLIGNSEMSKELSEAGFHSFGDGPDVFEDKETLLSSVNSCLDKDVGAVIIGFDLNISYSKFMKAANYLENPNCIFIATDTDAKVPWKEEKMLRIPGAGATIAAIETCSGRKATVVGKPSSSLFKVIQKDHGLHAERTLMIGDNGTTDVLFGSNSGLHTLLVLTGITTESDISRWKLSSSSTDAMMLPDYCLPKLGDLLPLIQ